MSSSPNPGAARPVGGRSLLISFVLLFAVGIGFGLMLTLNRVAMLDGIPYLAYVFWQMLGGGSVLLVISLVRSTPPRFDFAHLRCYVLCGLVGMGGSFVLLAIVAPNIPVGVLALGIGISPMVTYLFASMMKLDRFRWLKSGGMVLGLGGVLLIVVPQHSLPSSSMIGWVLIGLCPSVLLAAQTVWIERYRPQNSDLLALSAGFMLITAIFLFFVMVMRGDWWFFSGPMSNGDWSLVGVTVILPLDIMAVFILIRRAGSVFFSTVSYVDILTGMGWGMLIFGEQHSAWIWSALVCLMAGLFMVTKPERNRRTRHS